jgi:hypothetical protein
MSRCSVPSRHEIVPNCGAEEQSLSRDERSYITESRPAATRHSKVSGLDVAGPVSFVGSAKITTPLECSHAGVGLPAVNRSLGPQEAFFVSAGTVWIHINMQALDQTTLPKLKNAAETATARTSPMPLDSMPVGSLGSAFCRDAVASFDEEDRVEMMCHSLHRTHHATEQLGEGSCAMAHTILRETELEIRCK